MKFAEEHAASDYNQSFFTSLSRMFLSRRSLEPQQNISVPQPVVKISRLLGGTEGIPEPHSRNMKIGMDLGSASSPT